jgi:hypothetical protein
VFQLFYLYQIAHTYVKEKLVVESINRRKRRERRDQGPSRDSAVKIVRMLDIRMEPKIRNIAEQKRKHKRKVIS